jgi:hypothetical protein
VRYYQIVVLFLVSVAESQAGVIYSNLGPGDTFSTIANFMSAFAQPFRTTDAAYLDQIQIPLRIAEGADNIIEVLLMTSILSPADPYTIPSQTVESWVIEDQLTTVAALVTATSILHPLLAADTEYFVVARFVGTLGTTGPASAAWQWNSINAPGTPRYCSSNECFGPSASSLDGQVGWALALPGAEALRVTGLDVLPGQDLPEPTTFSLIAGSFASAMLWRIATRKRRRCVSS